MSSVVEKVGKAVSDRVPAAPSQARSLLEAAYTFVSMKGKLYGHGSVGSLVERYNGAIAATIVRAMRHPHNSVLVNIFMPCELIHAMGLIPMFPEGISVYLACTSCSSVFASLAEEYGVPETLCSYHKVMIGMVESGVLPAPALVANTTLACDANQVSFRRIAQYCQVPHRVIDIPYQVNEGAVIYVENQLRDLAHELEDITHRFLDERRLSEMVARSGRTLGAMGSFFDLRAQVSLPMTTTGELCNFVATHCMLGFSATEDYANGLLAVARKARKVSLPKRAVPRVFWFHTLPNWQMTIRAIFDGAEACELVGNDIAGDSVMAMDSAHPFESMARRLVYNANNGGGERRVEQALKAAKRAGADGVIVFCHWGCKQTMGLSSLAKQRFEEAGLPTLILDGDGCDGRNVAEGQMVTRVNAFLEQLQARKGVSVSGVSL